MKVIITDVDSRKGFDVVNIIERNYKYQCVLCARKDTNFQLPLVYGRKVLTLRYDDYKRFCEDFSAILKINKTEELIYLPVSEGPTRFLYRYVEEYAPENLRYLLPSESFFNLCADKGKFQLYCEKNGFPVPKSYDKENIENLKRGFKPVLIKPVSGQGSVGIYHIDKLSDLQETLDRIDMDAHVIQERVTGKDQQVVGAFFLCKDGEVIASYGHRRLRTFPNNGGVTVFSRSEYNQDIERIGSALLREMNWSGLAMIEFMYDDPSQEWKIIELNPRIWGSIMLSAFSNANLLQKYIRLIVNKETEEHKDFKEVYIRWLYPFDLLALLKGEVTWRTFSKFNFKTTAYINWTYSQWLRSFAYLLYFTFNKSSLTRFIKKIA